MLFNQMMLEEEEELKKKEKELEKWLEKAPSGKLNCSRKGKRWDWYSRVNRDGKVVREYIHPERKEYIISLAKKEEKQRELKDIRQELAAIKQYKKVYERGHQNGKYMLITRLDRLERESPGIWFLLHGEEEQFWEKQEYPQKQGYEEQKKYPSNRGLLTRSKSESIIASVLEETGIPFRYEERLELGNHPVYPDFTLRHPQSGKIVYWEHFGMMDDNMYRSDCIRKINSYVTMGFIPGINMITSYESKDKPMSFSIAKAFVEYFLKHMQ